MSWSNDAYKYLLSEEYEKVVSICENQIEADSNNISNYWYLGLSYLLTHREEEAQTSWLFGLSKIDDTRSDLEESPATSELIEILNIEASRQLELGQVETSWLISCHCRELQPNNLSNFLRLLEIQTQNRPFKINQLDDLNLFELLSEGKHSSKDEDSLLSLIEKLSEFPSHDLVILVQSCFDLICNKQDWLNRILKIANRVGDHLDFPNHAASLIEICVSNDPENIEFIKRLCHFYIYSGRYKEAITTAYKYCELSTSFEDEFLSNYELLAALMRAGSWREIQPAIEKNKNLLQQIFNGSQAFSSPVKPYIIIAASLLAYTQDNIEENRYFLNNSGKLFVNKYKQNQFPKRISNVSSKINKKIKIGYIGSTLRAHSVGWLSRWLFAYHDHEKFHISAYLVNQILEDPFYMQWFQDKVDHTQTFELDPLKIASKIYEDELDILIDLDSVTLNVTYEVMALKPAPVQVTWLGWDAPGLSTVDYFIADPYVLPQDAQKHYQETIWRLPQTYIAVDGFEIGTPELTKIDLGIPNDAVVFFSSQTGSKRNPSTIRLQLKVIKEVPGSYFLIKAIGDTESVKELFYSLAEQEGVTPDRLKFIQFTSSEFIHRANLQIADVVLDTYPYNGATTTLETLWMGIPIVTRVGNTFSARNSYSFMMNVGVTEGISWTDEEYIEWGVRLGKSEDLRQQVYQKLRKSRQSSPLWNTKQFTNEIENAYFQMWTRFHEC